MQYTCQIIGIGVLKMETLMNGCKTRKMKCFGVSKSHICIRFFTFQLLYIVSKLTSGFITSSALHFIETSIKAISQKALCEMATNASLKFGFFFVTFGNQILNLYKYFFIHLIFFK